MTNEELLELARTALPNSLETAALRIVRQGGNEPALLHQRGRGQGGSLEDELAQMLNVKLPSAPSVRSDSVDVAATEPAAVGVRTTVVQIRNGVVWRVISQA